MHFSKETCINLKITRHAKTLPGNKCSIACSFQEERKSTSHAPPISLCWVFRLATKKLVVMSLRNGFLSVLSFSELENGKTLKEMETHGHRTEIVGRLQATMNTLVNSVFVRLCHGDEGRRVDMFCKGHIDEPLSRFITGYFEDCSCS